MTAPTPIGPETSTWLRAVEAVAEEPAPPRQVGPWERARLTEPVRLWLYTLLLIITAGLQLAGYLTGDWVEFAATNGALLLVLGAGAEGIRSQVYSPAGVIRSARAAAAAVRR